MKIKMNKKHEIYSYSNPSSASAHKLNMTSNCIYSVSENHRTPNQHLQDHHSSIWGALNSKPITGVKSYFIINPVWQSSKRVTHNPFLHLQKSFTCNTQPNFSAPFSFLNFIPTINHIRTQNFAIIIITLYLLRSKSNRDQSSETTSTELEGAELPEDPRISSSSCSFFFFLLCVSTSKRGRTQIEFL